MNIALRPSGGRGEYELAGRQGELHVHDLYGLPMSVEILPGVVINARSHCILSDGKPRIRQRQDYKNAHPASLIAAAMLLPQPRRERAITHGAVLLQRREFVIQTIRIDVVRSATSVLIRPVIVRIENADGLRLDINFAERMARVLRVWTAAATGTNPVSEAVRAHATAFSSAASSQAQLVGAYARLYSALRRPQGDLLPIVEAHFKLGTLSGPSVGDISAEVADEDFAEDVHISAAEARVERVRQWRLSAIRGAAAAGFRRNVRDAYNWRCLFSGQRLPRTEATVTAGVDAAHILPWSRFDIDATRNGLCLSKQCHWAFDSGVFRLSFDEPEKRYILSIPKHVPPAAKESGFDLEPFQAIVGPIPRNRLPANEALWPSPDYIGELNKFLDGKTG